MRGEKPQYSTISSGQYPKQTTILFKCKIIAVLSAADCTHSNPDPVHGFKSHLRFQLSNLPRTFFDCDFARGFPSQLLEIGDFYWRTLRFDLNFVGKKYAELGLNQSGKVDEPQYPACFKKESST